MCGRYVSPEEAEIERAWEIGRRNNNPFVSRYNTAPTMQVPVLTAEEAGLILDGARWGFIPSWWKQGKPPTATINARIESAPTKPMWRQSWRQSRCLVPARGWFEWTVQEGVNPETGEILRRKQPFFLYREDAPVIAFAGLYARWPRQGQDPVYSCAILTREAAPALTEVHDRMPVVLGGESQQRWLSGQTKSAEDVMEASLADGFSFHPVSSRVNSPRNEGPELLEPVG